MKIVKILVALCIFCQISYADPSLESGTASWFGKYHHGRKTASGEIFDMYALTAAHKKYEFGTILKVTNEQNGKSVIVKVNDRGPFAKKRVLDLSYGAASKINMVNVGVTNVKMEQVGSADGTPLDNNLVFYVYIDTANTLQKQNEVLNKLVRFGESNVNFLDYENKKVIALGPYTTFDMAQDKFLMCASTHPNAEIILVPQ